MIYRDFIIEKNEEFGEMGFRPSFMEDGEAFGALTLAHDMLEHTPLACKVGGAAGEFMAMGAIWYIRGQGSYWPRYLPFNVNSPEHHISSDIPGILSRVASGKQTLKDPGFTNKLCPKVEEAFRNIIDRGLGEAQSSGTTIDFVHNPDVQILGWMRKGYRDAQRRYKGKTPFNLTTLFRTLELGAKEALERWYEGYAEGTRVRVGVCPKTLTCTFSWRDKA